MYMYLYIIYTILHVTVTFCQTEDEPKKTHFTLHSFKLYITPKYGAFYDALSN